MNVIQRNKKRPVVVQQSPQTVAERAEAARTKAELTEALSDMKYALDASRKDYDDLELLANRTISKAEARAYKVGAVCVTLGVGLGAVLALLPW